MFTKLYLENLFNSALFSNKIDLVKLMHVIFYEAYYLRNIFSCLSNGSAIAQ